MPTLALGSNGDDVSSLVMTSGTSRLTRHWTDCSAKDPAEESVPPWNIGINQQGGSAAMWHFQQIVQSGTNEEAKGARQMHTRTSIDDDVEEPFEISAFRV